jgi:hypothetical protein
MVLETNRAFTFDIKNLLTMVDIKSSLTAALPYLQINPAITKLPASRLPYMLFPFGPTQLPPTIFKKRATGNFLWRYL